MGLSEMGEAALAYANRGWAVFPLHTPVEGRCSCRQTECRDIGKHPRTRQGSNDASADLAVVERWWDTWPTANIAIACAPSNLVIIDIDPRHGGDESLRDLVEEHGEEWLDTVSVVTGGGGDLPAGLHQVVFAQKYLTVGRLQRCHQHGQLVGGIPGRVGG